jgi:ribosomal-protein-alanine N-acetyltransferase
VADDAEAIRALQNRCFPDPWSRADIGAQLALSGAVAVVAETESDTAQNLPQNLPQNSRQNSRQNLAENVGERGEILGYAFGQCVVDEVELRSIATMPEWRRRGLGHDVLAAFLEIGRGIGGRQVFLEVAADNSAAIAFYFSFGFSCIGKRTGYYCMGRVKPVDALIMKYDQI